MNTPASLLFAAVVALLKTGVVSAVEELDDEDDVVVGGFIRSVIRGVGAPAEFTRRRTDCCGLFDKLDWWWWWWAGSGLDLLVEGGFTSSSSLATAAELSFREMDRTSGPVSGRVGKCLAFANLGSEP